jgi:hypothetical protein
MHRFVTLLYFICWLLHVSAVDVVVYHIMRLSGMSVGVNLDTPTHRLLNHII